MTQERVLRAVLLYFEARPGDPGWSAEQHAEWKALTGLDYACSAAIVDLCKRALAPATPATPATPAECCTDPGSRWCRCYPSAGYHEAARIRAARPEPATPESLL